MAQCIFCTFQNVSLIFKAKSKRFLLNYLAKQLSADALARKTSFVTCQPWTSSEVYAINYIYIATTGVSETGISQKYG